MKLRGNRLHLPQCSYAYALWRPLRPHWRRHWTTRHVWTSTVIIIFMDWCTEQVIFWIDIWIHSFSGIERQHWTVASSICTVRRVTAERYNCDYSTGSTTYIVCTIACSLRMYFMFNSSCFCYVLRSCDATWYVTVIATDKLAVLVSQLYCLFATELSLVSWLYSSLFFIEPLPFGHPHHLIIVHIVIFSSRHIISFIVSHNIINSGVEFLAITGPSVSQLVTSFQFRIVIRWKGRNFFRVNLRE